MTVRVADDLTPGQTEAVARRDGSLLLFANAGSGKTRVMVERFVRAVTEDGVAIGSILAITFTDKAAGELRDRIHRAFAERGDLAGTLGSEGAWISTIHGFCARILRSGALLAGLDPEFAVLDERAAERLAAEAFDLALADFLDERGDPALELVAAQGVDALRVLIPDLASELRSRGQTRPALPVPAPPDTAAQRAALDAATAPAGAELAGATTAPVNVEAATAAVAACRAWLDGGTTAVPSPAALVEFALPTGHVSALAGAGCERYRGALEAYARACRDHHAARACALLAELLAGFGARYAELKAERSALDFEDLELRARDLLRDHADVRAAWAARFTHVMVDELQDTNRLQMEILELLHSSRLFAVGDEFQSIYGFRHADVRIFRELRSRLDRAGRVSTLARSFRAHQPLLDVLNHAFEPLFGEAFVPLEAGRADPPRTPGPHVELLVVDAAGATDDAEPRPGRQVSAWRRTEAHALAERIAGLVGEDGWQPRDVVVLLRATTDIVTYERAIAERGVPTYVVGGRGYWGQRQVQDLVAYLSVLANPRDELRLYEVLASPLAGVSSDALALVARAGRGAGAWAALCDAATIDGIAPEDRERLVAVADLLARERAGAGRHAIEALVERALAATGYDLHVLGLPDGARRMANVRKLMRLAREFEASEGRDLRGFLDYVAALAGDAFVQDREGEAPVEGEQLDAVRLMTIHRAKGLEFPVVCVADLGRTPPARRPAVLVDGERVGLRLALGGGPAAGALDYDALLAAAQEREQREEERLFYVAMTRAQERLVLSGAIDCERWPAPAPGGRPLAWIARALAPGVATRLSPATPELEAPVEREGRHTSVHCRLIAAPAPGAAEAAPRSRTGGEAAPATEPPALAPVLAPPVAGPRRLSYSSLQDHASCGYRFYLERVLGLPRDDDAPPGDAAAGSLPAALRGTLAHELLEQLDLAAPAAPAPAAVRELAAMHGARPDADAVEDLRRLVGGFAASALCARLAAAEDVRREAAFLFALGPAADGVLLSGFVDVLAREPGGALVIDYKSDRVGDGDLATAVQERYAVQRHVYALAALRAGAPAVEVVHAFLERPGEPVAARFSVAEIPALERALAGATAGLLVGAYPVSDDPGPVRCRGCPGRGTLCSWPLERTLGVFDS